jgi:hypothetical protein
MGVAQLDDAAGLELKAVSSGYRCRGLAVIGCPPCPRTLSADNYRGRPIKITFENSNLQLCGTWHGACFISQ